MPNNQNYKDIDIQLELKDRINYAFIIQTTLLMIKRLMGKEDIDHKRLDDIMWDFFTDIPHDWMDTFFIDDVKKAFNKKTVDARPLWAGVKIDIETCKELELPIEKETIVMNPYLLKNAIINLLHRRDMLVRKKKIEQSTGVNMDIKTLDDLAKYDEEDLETLIVNNVDANIENEIKEIEKEIDTTDKEE